MADVVLFRTRLWIWPLALFWVGCGYFYERAQVKSAMEADSLAQFADESPAPRPMVLDDPHVFIPSADHPLPTPSPTPSPLPEAISYGQKAAWAWRIYYRGHYQRALDTFLELQAEEPDWRDGHYGAGMVFLALEDYPAARLAFEGAHASSPQWANPLFYMGYIAYHQGDLEIAQGHLKAAQSRFDTLGRGGLRADGAWLLVRIALALGQLDEAEGWIDEALAVSHPGQRQVSPRFRYQAGGDIPASAWQALPRDIPLKLEVPLYLDTPTGLLKVEGERPLAQRMAGPLEARHHGHPTASKHFGLATVAYLLGPDAGPYLLWQSPEGVSRILKRRRVAPTQASFLESGELLLLAQGADGEASLYRVNPQRDLWTPVAGPERPGRLADIVHVGPGRQLASVMRRGHLSVVEWTSGTPKWLGSLSAKADPWGPSGSKTQRPSEKDDAEARAAALEALSEASNAPRAPLDLASPLDGGRGGVLMIPEAKKREEAGPESRDYWDFQGGAPVEVEAEAAPKPRLEALTPVEMQKGLALGPDKQGDERHPTLSPDGRIVFSRLISGGHRLWMVDAKRQNQWVLTAPDWDCYAPAFSPSGRMLLALCKVDGLPQIHRIDLQGKAAPERLFFVDGGVQSFAFEGP